MRTRKAVSVLFTGGMAAAAVAIPTATPAQAAGQTWTVNPGGAYTMRGASSVAFKSTTNGAALTCAAGTAGGALATSATGTSSAKIGTLSTAAFGTSAKPCTSTDGKGVTLDLTAGAQPWSLKGYLYTKSLGTTSGFAKDMHLTVAGVGDACKATLSGTGTFRYTNSTGALVLSGVLKATSVASCPGGIATGAYEEFRTTYTVSPKQTVTEQS